MDIWIFIILLFNILGILKLYDFILEKFFDYELKNEVINLLRCLFFGKFAFGNMKIPSRYEKIKMIISNDKIL